MSAQEEPIEGTHPMAVVGIVSGIMSIVCGAFCCLDPRLAGVMHTVLGLMALGTGTGTWVKVKRGRLETHNLFQARFALALGAVGFAAGVSWLVWWYLHPDGR